eukprot:281126_1
MADETLSITSLTSRFPQDILQYILSFNRSCDVSSICKVFKQCDNNNTNHMNRQRMAAIDQHAFHHQIKYDESISCTYIVDPTRDHLLPHEIHCGYALFSSLTEAVEQSKSGDKLLIYGSYKPHTRALRISCDLQLIGVENTVTIRTGLYIAKGAKVYMKNVS